MTKQPKVRSWVAVAAHQRKLGRGDGQTRQGALKARQAVASERQMRPEEVAVKSPIKTFRHADGREMAVMEDGRILRKRAGGKRFTVFNQVTRGDPVALAEKIAQAHGYREVAND